MTSLCWSHGVRSSCWYALIMQSGPLQWNTHTQIHAYAQEGRADIWYMRAMINRLIRNGLIKFTLHIKTGSTHDSTYSELECVRDWLRVCSGLRQSAGDHNLFARRWSEPFSYLIAEQQSGWLRLDCLSPSQKSWGSERQTLSLKKKVASNSSMSQ